MKKILFSLGFLGVTFIAIILFLSLHLAPVAAPKISGSQAKSDNPAVKVFNKSELSNTDPASIWVVVNKKHPLSPKDYVPADLVFPNIPLRVPGNESMQVRRETASALEAMFAAAKEEDLSLMLSSGYRSYKYQVNLYNGYVQSQGQAVADTQSARPGFSEHQTGLAADIEPASRKCEVEDCFAETPEGQWLKTNAYKYGFILRYQNDDQSVTGYKGESWHYRYVGLKLSNELMRASVTTLEAFFGVPGGD
ncbi:M15 family metallopeptidase [Polaromonas sp.]|nr:M15 family metallopeptidase [Candidatus Saccharibacteria bacterium]